MSKKDIPAVIQKLEENDKSGVFSEWEHFKKRGVETIAERHLLNTLNGCASAYQQFLTSWTRHLKTSNNLSRSENTEIVYKNEWLTKEAILKKICDVFLFEGLHYTPELNFFITHNCDIKYLSHDDEFSLIDAIERNKKMKDCRAKLVKKHLEIIKIATFNKNYFQYGEYLIEITNNKSTGLRGKANKIGIGHSGLNEYEKLINGLPSQKIRNAFITKIIPYKGRGSTDPKTALSLAKMNFSKEQLDDLAEVLQNDGVEKFWGLVETTPNWKSYILTISKRKKRKTKTYD